MFTTSTPADLTRRFSLAPVPANDASPIYLLDLSGAAPRPVTSGKSEQFMRCTPDGTMLVFFSFEDDSVHKVFLEGGSPQVLIGKDRNASREFSIAPDGKELAIDLRAVGPGESQHQIDSISIQSGEVSRRNPIPPAAIAAFLSPDDQEVAHHRHERGVHNLWLPPVKGGDPLRLADFHLSGATNQTILAFAWSPDGKRFGNNPEFLKERCRKSSGIGGSKTLDMNPIAVRPVHRSRLPDPGRRYFPDGTATRRIVPE